MRGYIQVAHLRIYISGTTYLSLLRQLSGLRAPQFKLEPPEPQHRHILRLIASKNVNIHSLKETLPYDEMQTLTHQSARKKELGSSLKSCPGIRSNLVRFFWYTNSW